MDYLIPKPFLKKNKLGGIVVKIEALSFASYSGGSDESTWKNFVSELIM